ncbi:MAG: hypothetical protein NTX68_17320, partial [Rhodococcus sp.]|nr:hypothetical protein [Rhodococcus sp. (in: high G+C Gram-positive bacteria)]
MSEGNSRSGDAPKGAEPHPDVPPYDTPTEVFGAIRDDAEAPKHAEQPASEGQDATESEANDADVNDAELTQAEGTEADGTADADRSEPVVDLHTAGEPDVDQIENGESAAPGANAQPAPVADESPTVAQPVVLPSSSDAGQPQPPAEPPSTTPENGSAEHNGSGSTPP